LIRIEPSSSPPLPVPSPPGGGGTVRRDQHHRHGGATHRAHGCAGRSRRRHGRRRSSRGNEHFHARDRRARCLRPPQRHVQPPRSLRRTTAVVAWDDRTRPMQPVGSLHGTTALVPCNQRGRCMGRPHPSHATSGVVAWDDRACPMQPAGSLHGTTALVPCNERGRCMGQAHPSRATTALVLGGKASPPSGDRAHCRGGPRSSGRRPRSSHGTSVSVPWTLASLRRTGAVVPWDHRGRPRERRGPAWDDRGRAGGRGRSCRARGAVVGHDEAGATRKRGALFRSWSEGAAEVSRAHRRGTGERRTALLRGLSCLRAREADGEPGAARRHLGVRRARAEVA
jgi:hypothetical protein